MAKLLCCELKRSVKLQSLRIPHFLRNPDVNVFSITGWMHWQVERVVCFHVLYVWPSWYSAHFNYTVGQRTIGPVEPALSSEIWLWLLCCVATNIELPGMNICDGITSVGVLFDHRHNITNLLSSRRKTSPVEARPIQPIHMARSSFYIPKCQHSVSKPPGDAPWGSSKLVSSAPYFPLASALPPCRTNPPKEVSHVTALVSPRPSLPQSVSALLCLNNFDWRLVESMQKNTVKVDQERHRLCAEHYNHTSSRMPRNALAV